MDTQLFEKIRDMLADSLGISPDDITPDSDIIDDLEADSLDVVEMVMALEDEYGIEVPDEDVENLRTVAAVIAYVEEHT